MAEGYYACDDNICDLSNNIKKYVDENLTQFGVNKQQEIVRLVFEIAKREKVNFLNVINDGIDHLNRFSNFKNYLMERRFPNLYLSQENKNYAFSELDLNPSNQVTISETQKFNPKYIYVEKAAVDSVLTKRIKERFVDAEYKYINTYTEYIKDKEFGCKEFNDRLNHLFIVCEKFEHLVPCPCSGKSVSCGYEILNLGYGCLFECEYCFLQGYMNSPGIIIPANIGDFLSRLKNKNGKRIGSGQFTDSLVFDDITGFSKDIIDFFREYPNQSFEFKTKSNNIKTILSVKPSENIIIAWSLNPQHIIDTTEHYTASLEDRLECAKKCACHGYRIAFHFDPIVYYEGWENDYKNIVSQIFNSVDDGDIAWISLGCLRMTQQLKKMIENRFPYNTILDGELMPGYDGKLRYSYMQRKQIYSYMKSWIRSFSSNVPLYLCMENKDMWNDFNPENTTEWIFV